MIPHRRPKPDPERARLALLKNARQALQNHPWEIRWSPRDKCTVCRQDHQATRILNALGNDWHIQLCKTCSAALTTLSGGIKPQPSH